MARRTGRPEEHNEEGAHVSRDSRRRSAGASRVTQKEGVAPSRKKGQRHDYASSARVPALTSQTRTSNRLKAQKRTSATHEEGDDDEEVDHGRAKSGSVEARSSLRGKFMGTMAGITAVTLVFLGALLVYTSSSFVTGISMHNGVQLAKMTATVVRARLDSSEGTISGEDLAFEIREYIKGASSWKQGDGIDGSYSDILNISVNGTKVSGFPLKGKATGGSIGKRYPSVFVPRIGDVQLGDDIEIFELEYEGTPCYRYKITMPGTSGMGFDATAKISIDIAADAISAVNIKMYIYIGIGICVSMFLVVIVSSRFTDKITKPVNILVRDIAIVANGDLSHRTKPHSNDEIGVLAHAFNKMTSSLKAAQDAMVEQEKAAYEMNLAKDVQQQLLPQALPKLENFEIASYYLGAKAVSGDYFDFIPLGDGIWGFIIADVSGKGIPGSLVMAQCRTVVRLVANQYPNKASETLKKTNRLLAKQIKRGMFITAFYAILNEHTGALTYSSAGHNPLIIYRAATKSYELATPKGIAIGFNEGPLFDKNIQEESAILGPGDSFMLYTDGFPEAMNAEEEEFGDDPFYDVVANSGHLSVGQMKDSVVNAIEQHRGAAAQSDDLTLIVVKRKG